MKKISLLLLTFCLCACQVQQPKTSNKKFACDANEVSKDCTTKDTSSTTFKEISFDDAISYFTEKKSGVLFFGFRSCPWCKEARPILKKVAKKYNVDIQYIKTRDDDENRIYTDEQKEKIEPYIQDYMSKNNDGVLTLYVPLVLVVKNGVVQDGHEGTVDSHDATKRKMTKDEKEELTTIYKKLMNEAK